MSKSKRDSYTLQFKFQVAIEAMKGDRTLPQLASESYVPPYRITQWEEQQNGNANVVFGSPDKRKSLLR